jgi:nucleoside-diphosphate-sugar epimerase
MKILITGARGNFPTALIPRLAAEEYELVLYDLEPMNAPEHCVSVQGDIRDASLLTYAMQGCDAVIHAAAYRGSDAETRNEEDFYSVNVTGTHNVLRAMLLHGISYLVFSSSDVVYGNGMREMRVMDETVPLIPRCYYGMTKVLGEEMCRFYAHTHDFHIAMLRYGNFSPTDALTAGMGRLNNRLDRDDVAQANVLALGAVLTETFACEPFLIHCAKPFRETDWPELESAPDAVIERYYPGALELLAEHGLAVPKVHTLYDIHKAVTVLGYDPEYNFDQFLTALRESDRA